MGKPLTVEIPSGLVLKDAATMLVKKFELWPWERYDGTRPADPNAIDPGVDVDRVYQLGARTSREAYSSLVRTQGRKISALLRQIPTNVALEDADLSSIRQPIIELFDLMMGVKFVKLAGATKLLHPFRPALFPVVDSVIENYYWFATSIGDEPAFRRLAASADGGEYFYEILCLVKLDVEGARSSLDRVLKACHGHSFSSASRVRALESLIWYYYAGTAQTTQPVSDK